MARIAPLQRGIHDVVEKIFMTEWEAIVRPLLKEA